MQVWSLAHSASPLAARPVAVPQLPALQVRAVLLDRNVNAGIRTFWDGLQWTWHLGDYKGLRAFGDASNYEEAVAQLAAAAREHYPDSDFAKSPR